MRAAKSHLGHRSISRLTAADAVIAIKQFFHDLQESRTFGLAAEMAFWLFLSLIPLAAIAGLVVAKVAITSSVANQALSSLPREMRTLINEQLALVANWNGESVGAPAVIVFFWLASGGIHSVFDLLEIRTGCSRPWWKKRFIALGTCVGLSFGTALIGVMGMGLYRILGIFHRAMGFASVEVEIGFLEMTIRIATGFLTALGLLAGLYWIGVPAAARRGKPILPGALVAVALQTLFGYGYVFYLAKMGTGSAYQAGLSIIGITLMALYLFASALLIGAEVNSTIARRRRAAKSPEFPRM